MKNYKVLTFFNNVYLSSNFLLNITFIAQNNVQAYKINKKYLQFVRQQEQNKRMRK